MIPASGTNVILSKNEATAGFLAILSTETATIETVETEITETETATTETVETETTEMEIVTTETVETETTEIETETAADFQEVLQCLWIR